MPQIENLKAGEKILLIRKYQKGGINLSEAVAQAEVREETFWRWVKRYESEESIPIGTQYEDFSNLLSIIPIIQGIGLTVNAGSHPEAGEHLPLSSSSAAEAHYSE